MRYTVPSYTYTKTTPLKATGNVIYLFENISVTRTVLIDYFNREGHGLVEAQSYFTFPKVTTIQSWVTCFASNIRNLRSSGTTFEGIEGDHFKDMLDTIINWARQQNKKLDLEALLAETTKDRSKALYAEAMKIIEKGIK